MNSDSFFTIGQSHKVCQDYAAHGIKRFVDVSPVQEMPYAIISDGCSGSPNSDFGSRILTKTAEHRLDFVDRNICRNSDLLKIVADLGLNPACLHATLIIASLENEVFDVKCYGDGVIAARKNDGTIVATQIKFDSGAPYYLYYDIANLWENWVKEFGTKAIKTICSISPEGKTEEFDSIKFEWENFVEVKFPADDYDLVAIFSDGIESFEQKNTTATAKYSETVPMTTILKEIMAFKSVNGEFVQRRCNAAFKKFKQNNWFNTDDFSVGVIHK